MEKADCSNRNGALCSLFLCPFLYGCTPSAHKRLWYPKLIRPPTAALVRIYTDMLQPMLVSWPALLAFRIQRSPGSIAVLIGRHSRIRSCFNRTLKRDLN